MKDMHNCRDIGGNGIDFGFGTIQCDTRDYCQRYLPMGIEFVWFWEAGGIYLEKVLGRCLRGSEGARVDMVRKWEMKKF